MTLCVKRNDLVGSKGVQTVRVAIFVTEFHLECIGGKLLDTRTDFASNQAELRQIAH
jgi:hypothetical protein